MRGTVSRKAQCGTLQVVSLHRNKQQDSGLVTRYSFTYMDDL